MNINHFTDEENKERAKRCREHAKSQELETLKAELSAYKEAVNQVKYIAKENLSGNDDCPFCDIMSATTIQLEYKLKVHEMRKAKAQETKK